MRRMPLLLLVALVALVLAADPALRHAHAAAFLDALGRPDAPDAAPLVERDVTVPGRHGPVRARLYQRADTSRFGIPEGAEGGQRGPGLVLAHGVHYQGIDERRLVPFARQLARAGRVVLTPQLEDLTEYRITAQGADTIADATLWLSRSAHVSRPQVGVLGFSFAGGLALVAASRPELSGKVEFVTSVGGHHDLSRVLGFLLSDRVETPAGPRAEKAHEYGLVVLVYRYAEHFVDPADAAVMRDALRHWLREDRPASLAAASRSTTLSGRELFTLLESGRLAELRPQLEGLLHQERASLGTLSPAGRLHDIPAPVYLLHGASDRVIPPAETEWAERELGARPHQALVSPLLEHVEVSGRSRVTDELALVGFMSRML